MPPKAKAEKVDEYEDVEVDEPEEVEIEVDFEPAPADSDDEDEEGEIDVVDNRVEPDTSLKKYKRVITGDARRTSDRLSIFECARVLGERARHITNGAKIYAEDYAHCRSAIEIAYVELVTKKIPMSVIRKVGLGCVEIWELHEMTLPQIPTIDYFSKPLS